MDITFYKKYEPIDGKWYLNKEIGRGAYGVVFEAERRDMIKGTRAIKVVSIPASPNDVASYKQDNFSLDDRSVTSYFYGFVEEFLKEIKIMSLFMGHSNIVNIEDYDIKERTDEIGWDIFIRMELLTPINKHFSVTQVTEKAIIKLACDICKALEACRENNVIHRDIKPSNIFISSTGDFKLGDFGVARTLEKTSSGLSKKGTYTYMAPEIYRGESYDASVDIYSLGIVLYKLLNNNYEPFKTGSSFSDEENALIRRMKGEKIVIGPANASKELTNIILKACSYEPEDRFSSPTEMRLALENVKNYNYEDTCDTFETTETDDSIVTKVFDFITNKTKCEHGINVDSNGMFALVYKAKIKENIEKLKSGAFVVLDFGFISNRDGNDAFLKAEIRFVDGVANGSVSIKKIGSGKSENEENLSMENKSEGDINATIISRLMNLVFIKIQNESGIDITKDIPAVTRIEAFLKERIEKIRSGIPILIDLPFLTATAKGPIHLKTEVSIDDISVANTFDNNREVNSDTQYGYNYTKNDFGENRSRKESVFEQDDEGTIGVFSSIKSKQSATSLDSDNYSFEPNIRQQNIHKSNQDEVKLDSDLEISYRYVAEMVKLRDGVDITVDPSIKKLICDKISLELADLKNGGILFLRCDVKSNVCGNFKISVDLSLQNAKCYFVAPAESMSEEMIKWQVDSCINNLNIAYAKNQKTEAARLCIMALTYSPGLVGVWITLGKIYRELNRSTIALECYEKAMKLNPKAGMAYSNAVVAYLDLNQYAKAKECATNAILLLDKNDPNYAITLANCSLVEFKLGNKKRAKEMLHSAKKAGYKNYNALKQMMK